MKKLLSRGTFREECFKRDKGKCVFCNEPSVDAHHILDRKLFSDGGYYLDNAASVCSKHHLDCEYTRISLESVYEACGIKEPVLPDGFSKEAVYDKWGNKIVSDYQRLPGPLFHDTAVQKIFKERGDIWMFYTIQQREK